MAFIAIQVCLTFSIFDLFPLDNYFGSGPKRYDYCENSDDWVYSRDGRAMGELLNEELSKAFNRGIDLELAQISKLPWDCVIKSLDFSSYLSRLYSLVLAVYTASNCKKFNVMFKSTRLCRIKSNANMWLEVRNEGMKSKASRKRITGDKLFKFQLWRQRTLLSSR